MPKILITGNGFDLSIGLPTSYSDFIKILTFVEREKNINFESVYSNSSGYSNLSSTFKIFTLDEFKIGQLRDEINKNLWYKFFREEFEIETWIDFENKIEYVLKNLFSSIECIKEKVFSGGSLKEDRINYDATLFNNNIEIIEILSSFSIISKNRQLDIKLNTDFLIRKYGFFIDIDLDKVTKFLYQELEDFKRIFNYYFEIFIYPLYDKFKVRIDRGLLFSTIQKHYTFNYTPTFEKLYKKPNVTKFLHGKIDSNSNKIVLGINEIPNAKVDTKYFIPFTKYFQKLNNSTEYIFIKEYEKKLNDNYIFFFWGHSLDQSDADYIDEVFDFVNKLKSKIKKIIVIYHVEECKSRLIVNLLNIRGKDDIIELMRDGVLLFLHIDSPELKRELNKDITKQPVSYF